MGVPGTISGHYAKIWLGKTEGTTDVSWNNLYIVHILPLYSFERMPSKTKYLGQSMSNPAGLT